jgi:3-deoxy-7-phosphoheptulonate synthase
MLEKNKLFPTIMVDCSHGNSEKNHEKQPLVLENVIDQIVAGNRTISGVMIESFIEGGNQPIPKDLSQLRYGLSITDKCIDWETTERILREAHGRLKSCGGRQLA